MIEKIKLFAVLRNRDRGASATEYALIMGFIVAGLIAILFIFGPAIADQFNEACNRITPADKCV